MVCDDCGEAAQIIVSELITRGVDVLCWSCQMARVTAAVTFIMQEEEKAEANAARL